MSRHAPRCAAVALALAAAILLGRPAPARACPFCSAVSLTFAQEIAQSQAAVIVRLVEPPPSAAFSPRAEGPLPKGKFAVVETLKGAALVAEAGHAGPDGAPIETILLENKPLGTLFLLMGIEPPKLVWSSPIPVSERAVEYLRKLPALPEKGPDRLAFFQEHLEDPDETLARDAYDEFAVAPYADVRGLAPRMSPARLLEWIENPKVQANRRRLYATMLGTCGTKADAERIAAILANEGLGPEKADVRSGLDALIACYVTLRGPEGLDLVDRLFLDRQGREIPFTETYAAVMALRFLGEESDVVPRERVLASLRRLLAEPKLADLVVADLARWEDWSVIDRLVELFEKAEADNIFVREPIVNYLRACPLPAAAAAITRLEKIDPEAVRRAATLAAFAGALGPKPAPAAAADGDPGDPGSPAQVPAVPPAAMPPGGVSPAGVSPAGVSVASAAQPRVGETGIAARIPPTLADEDATDGTPGIDPARPAPPTASPAAAGSTALPPAPAPAGRAPAWVWAAVAAGILLLAALSRSMLRAGAADSSPR